MLVLVSSLCVITFLLLSEILWIPEELRLVMYSYGWGFLRCINFLWSQGQHGHPNSMQQLRSFWMCIYICSRSSSLGTGCLVCLERAWASGPCMKTCLYPTVSEDCLHLYRTGSDDSEQLVEVLVAVLEAIRSLFELLADNQLSTLPQCASLLLKWVRSINSFLALFWLCTQDVFSGLGTRLVWPGVGTCADVHFFQLALIECNCISHRSIGFLVVSPWS